jgi:hypothetical protein
MVSAPANANARRAKEASPDVLEDVVSEFKVFPSIVRVVRLQSKSGLMPPFFSRMALHFTQKEAYGLTISRSSPMSHPQSWHIP